MTVSIVPIARSWPRIAMAGTPPRALRPDEQVDDCEQLIHGVIGRVGSARGIGPADLDELFGHLCAQAVVLTGAYDPHRDVTGRLVFRAWLFRELSFDAIDFLRSWLGRSGEKRVADVVPSRFDDSDDLEPAGVGRLGRAAATGEGDSQEGWADAVGRLYARGDRATLREERRMGFGEGAGAAAGAGGAARGAAGRDASRGSAAGAGAGIDCAWCGWRSYRVAAPNGAPGWRFPDRCVACGRPLQSEAAA